MHALLVRALGRVDNMRGNGGMSHFENAHIRVEFPPYFHAIPDYDGSVVVKSMRGMLDIRRKDGGVVIEPYCCAEDEETKVILETIRKSVVVK